MATPPGSSTTTGIDEMTLKVPMGIARLHHHYTSPLILVARSYSIAMPSPLKPGQYGYAIYDSAKPEKEDVTKRIYAVGTWVLWKSKGVVGQVLSDYKDYGVQIEFMDPKNGKFEKRLVPKWDADRSSLLEAIARVC